MLAGVRVGCCTVGTETGLPVCGSLAEQDCQHAFLLTGSLASGATESGAAGMFLRACRDPLLWRGPLSGADSCTVLLLLLCAACSSTGSFTAAMRSLRRTAG